MVRYFRPTLCLAAMLAMAGWDSRLARGDEPMSAVYEETAADEQSFDDAVEPVYEANSAEPETFNAMRAAEVGEAAVPLDGDEEAPAISAETDAEPAVGDEEPAAEAKDDVEVEVIRERYPNRAVKIEREVTQDKTGNYVNHGTWRMWDQKGTPIAEGQYRKGQRNGVWNRWYLKANEIDLLTKAPFNQFQGPYISQANFKDDKLDGKWTIYDAKQRKISEWEFTDGARDGRWTWWFATGRKMREIDYDGGVIDGQFLEWSVDGKLTHKDTYEHGRKLAARSESYPNNGGKKSEGMFLFSKLVLQTPDDWWEGKPATYAKTGNDEKHGPWMVWFPTGQKQTEGEYRNDVQIGKFTWWYQNGQKAIQGDFADGEQQGKWVWWHENGQKSIQGEYTHGHPSGQWTWWNQDGKVARATQMENGSGEIVQTPATPHSAAKTDNWPAQPRLRTTR